MARSELAPEIRKAIGTLAQMEGTEIEALVLYIRTTDGMTEMDIVANHPQVTANTLIVAAAALIAGDNPQNFPQATQTDQG